MWLHTLTHFLRFFKFNFFLQRHLITLEGNVCIFQWRVA